MDLLHTKNRVWEVVNSIDIKSDDHGPLRSAVAVTRMHPTTFEYNLLPEPVAKEARGAAATIVEQQVAINRSVVIIGSSLSKVRALLPFGAYEAWLESEIGIQPRLARYYIRGYDFLIGKSEKFSDLPITAIFKLSSPSAPQEAVEEITRLVHDGVRVKLVDIDASFARARKPIPASEHIAKSIFGRQKGLRHSPKGSKTGFPSRANSSLILGHRDILRDRSDPIDFDDIVERVVNNLDHNDLVSLRSICRDHTFDDFTSLLRVAIKES
jgi:hypothetical protein